MWNAAVCSTQLVSYYQSTLNAVVFLKGYGLLVGTVMINSLH